MTKTVEMTTSEGTIRIELDDVKAPKSTENFLAYVRAGHYDGTVFHRVIKGFMVQGGGFEAGMKQRTTREPIANEANNGPGRDAKRDVFERHFVAKSACNVLYFDHGRSITVPLGQSV